MHLIHRQTHHRHAETKKFSTLCQVGGYSVVYKGDITLATVRGAGHEVPSYQPLRALALIESFLEGKPLPS